MAAMLRSQSGLVCPFCEFKTALAGRGYGVNRLSSTAAQQSIAARYASSQARTRRPKRMQLSESVSRPPTKRASAQHDRTLAAPRSKNSPFGGMNRTSVPAVVEAERRRLEAREARVKEKEARMRLRGLTVSSGTSALRKKTERRAPGVMKALQMQQALSKVSYDHRNAIKDAIADQNSFDDFPLLPSVKRAIQSDALRGLVDITPTPIQRLAIPALLGVRDRRGRRIRHPGANESSKQFLLAAETGSGKTLAYIIPTIDAIKRLEAQEAEQEAQAVAAKEAERRASGSIFELEPPPLSSEEENVDAGRPRAVVLAPSSELVDQIGKEFKKFSHGVKLRVAFISAAYTATVIRNRLFSGAGGVDVVVSTPHLLGSLARTEPNILSRVRHVIVDEADSLFDRSFAPLTTAIIERATPSMKQLILCSATIPRSLDNYLLKNYPDMQRLTTPNLHAIPRRIALSVVEIDKEPYKGNRKLACADYIWRVGLEVEDRDGGFSAAPQPTRIIVFVNEREAAEEVSAFLNSKGIDAVALSRDVSEQRRAEILAPFVEQATTPAASGSSSAQVERTAQPTTTRDGPSRSGGSSSRSTRRLADTQVLVTTDLGSRGIDTTAIKHVILHDVPHTSVDFIHRLGRIGRMGRRGRGVVLVGKEDRKDVVSEIREAVFRGSALI